MSHTKTHINYKAIMIIWLIFCLPLIWFGYGLDPDSARIVYAANSMIENLEYIKSRTTGFPLYEITVAPFVVFGKWYLSNLYTLMLGVIYFISIIKLSELHISKYPRLFIITTTFVPIIIISSTSTIDYMGAMASLGWSYYFYYRKQYYTAAVFIGIAAGFRPVFGLTILPLIGQLFINKETINKVFKIGFTATIVGSILYLPALLKYGLPQSAAIDITLKNHILYAGYNFLNFLGVIPTAFLGILFLYYTFIDRKIWVNKKHTEKSIVIHILNILLWLLIFLRLPYEAAYLLPTLISTVIIFHHYSSLRNAFIFSILVILQNFIAFELLSGESGKRSIKPSIQMGTTLSYINESNNRHHLREFFSNSFKPSQPTVLLFGYNYIPISNQHWSLINPNKEVNVQALYKHQKYELYAAHSEKNCLDYRDLYEQGYQLIAHNNEKSKLLNCDIFNKIIVINSISDLSK